ncbi:uncharacterized protein BXZ73DRAFT_102445 [Epithele typhae]|uniref:uncharacterized protein n=1 Tax=Epithele typhae TaxID=378194 RepID=UPI002007CCBB|nr:uncharacterized protein BXZ73DRAFT_102445 [Epithele typhae]KAH9927937.1 hypothetical protein BXZ73DRAFT_102445 [Epithele typhae]
MSHCLMFSTSDLANAKVRGDSSIDPQYEIKTVYDKDAQPHPRLATVIRNAGGKEVGVWTRKWAREPDRVSIRGGAPVRLLEWLSLSSGFTSARTFRAPDGRTYAWKEHMFSTSLKLVDGESGRTVATAKKGPRRIEYEPEVVPILDAVLMAYLVCVERQRASSNSTKGTVQALAGGIQ